MALAKKALAICPDCADAWNILGGAAGADPEAACEVFRKGMEAGQRALGPRPFVEDVGHFWGLLETRPCMRARANLAQTLWELGRRDEAISHVQEMLVLNPNDNQGNRYLLAAWLLEVDRIDELRMLIGRYPDDGYAGFAYAVALVAFREHGDTEESRRLLLRALESNPMSLRI